MVYIALLVAGGVLNLIIYNNRVSRVSGYKRGLPAAFFMGALIYGGLASALFALL